MIVVRFVQTSYAKGLDMCIRGSALTTSAVLMKMVFIKTDFEQEASFSKMNCSSKTSFSKS
jgi:hypothetical protein